MSLRPCCPRSLRAFCSPCPSSPFRLPHYPAHSPSFLLSQVTPRFFFFFALLQRLIFPLARCPAVPSSIWARSISPCLRSRAASFGIVSLTRCFMLPPSAGSHTLCFLHRSRIPFCRHATPFASSASPSCSGLGVLSPLEAACPPVLCCHLSLCGPGSRGTQFLALVQSPSLSLVGSPPPCFNWSPRLGHP